jgi:hypothetical protein
MMAVGGGGRGRQKTHQVNVIARGKVEFQLSVIHVSTFLPQQHFLKSSIFFSFFRLILSQSSRAVQTPMLLVLLDPLSRRER